MATGYIMLDSPNPYTAQGTYPRRGGYRPSGTCIVHTSEGAWTAGVDSLTGRVQRRTDYGCYHRACDWADIARYYPWSWECWQDSETNNWACGISFACRTSDWGNMPADVEEGYYRNGAKMAADFVRDMKSEYGITVPLRRITGAEARGRVPGFCAHGDSGIARSDPGANFDWARFFEYTRQELEGETDMPITKEDAVLIARTILDFAVDQVGVEGKLNLGALLAEYRLNNNKIVEKTAEWVRGDLDGVKELIQARPVAEVELDEADIASLAQQLRDTLSPGLAAELGRRLSAEE